jgi:inorganic pyrophosphatase
LLIDTLKPGTKPPDEINVVVEIPRGSKIKYEIDPKSGAGLVIIVAHFITCESAIPKAKSVFITLFLKSLVLFSHHFES